MNIDLGFKNPIRNVQDLDFVLDWVQAEDPGPRTKHVPTLAQVLDQVRDQVLVLIMDLVLVLTLHLVLDQVLILDQALVLVPDLVLVQFPIQVLDQVQLDQVRVCHVIWAHQREAGGKRHPES